MTEPGIHFTGWHKPLTRYAVEYLERRCQSHPTPTGDAGPPLWDLSRIVIVTSTARGGRLLLERLADRAQDASSPRNLVPPTLCTPGSLLPTLSPTTRHEANALEVLLAWAAAIRTTCRESPLSFLPNPDALSASDICRLARRLSVLHSELASFCLDAAAVASSCRSRNGYRDHQRWEGIARIQHRYLSLLDREGLADPAAIRFHASAPATSSAKSYDLVLLLGVPEMPRAIRESLLRVGARVVSLVHAPQTDASGFDSFGCVKPEAWCERVIDIPDPSIIIADDPRSQAMAALDCVAAYAEWCSPDEITVGVGDLRIQSVLRRVFAEANVPTHTAYRRPLSSSRPLQLLSAIGQYVADQSAEAFAALSRHPDLDRLSETHRSTSLLTALDKLRIEQLPPRIRAHSSLRSGYGAEVNELCRGIARVAGPLMGRRLPLADWAEPLARCLRSIYGSREEGKPPSFRRAPHDADLVQSVGSVGDLLRDLSSCSQALANEMTVTSSEAIGILQLLASDPLPEPYAQPACELLDWFDVHGDDAPVKILTGMNEGCVPERPPTDPLLPDTLRSELGLPCSSSRYARDAYILTATLAETAHTSLICGRTTRDGEPIAPSRLLLACDDETLTTRANRLFGEYGERDKPPALYFPSARKSVFAPRRPGPPEQPISELRVTAFRDYLACPYRFYLRHVLRLQALNDRAPEMDAALFGSVLHEAAGAFTRSDAAQMDDTDLANAALSDILDELIEQRFGRERLATVSLQLTQMRRRLRRLAEWHCAQLRLGWHPVPHWTEVEATADLDVDGIPFRLTGRIDRIDQYEDGQTYRLLDFKTSDSCPTPERIHRKKRDDELVWTDLQLPLYRLLAPCGESAAPQLAYVWLAPGPAQDLLQPAEWTEDDLSSADQCARDVIRRIRAGEFWPPALTPPLFGDDLAPICLDDCADRASLLRNPPAPWDTE